MASWLMTRGVDHRGDRHRGSDPESQCEGRDSREARSAEQRPQPRPRHSPHASSFVLLAEDRIEVGDHVGKTRAPQLLGESPREEAVTGEDQVVHRRRLSEGVNPERPGPRPPGTAAGLLRSGGGPAPFP